jgi:hypothetical protein
MLRQAELRRPRRRPAGPTLVFLQEQLVGEERRSSAATVDGRPEVALSWSAPRWGRMGRRRCAAGGEIEMLREEWERKGNNGGWVAERTGRE